MKSQSKSYVRKRLTLTDNFSVSPVSRRTRRQSLAVPWTKISETAKVPHASTSVKRLKPVANKMVSENSTMKKESRSKTVTISKTSLYKSPVRTRSIGSKITVAPLEKKIIVKVSPATQERAKIRLASTAKSQKMAGSARVIPSKNTADVKPKVTIKKPLKRLSTKATAKTPVVSGRCITRSGKKKVTIAGVSPTRASESYRKTPVVVRKTEIIRVNEGKHSINVQPRSPLVASSKKRYPVTPKPEDPSKIIKQSMKKTVAAKVKPNTSIVNSFDSIVKKSFSVEPRSKLPSFSTPSAFPDPQQTPKSSQRSSVRFQRTRNTVRSSSRPTDRERSVLYPSLLLDEPWSSTPLRNGMHNAEDSPIPDSNLMNISSVSQSSRSTDFTDSLSRSSLNGVEELKTQEVEVSAKTSGRSICHLM